MSDLTLYQAVSQLKDMTSDQVALLLHLADKKGIPQKSQACPMACYFNDVLGGHHSVGPYTVYQIETSDRAALPMGVVDFVHKFDNNRYPSLERWPEFVGDDDNAG